MAQPFGSYLKGPDPGISELRKKAPRSRSKPRESGALEWPARTRGIEIRKANNYGNFAVRTMVVTSISSGAIQQIAKNLEIEEVEL